MTGFIKCCRNTATQQIRGAYGQDSYLENHDKFYPSVEKPSWQQPGADAQTDFTWLTTSTVVEQFLICLETPELSCLTDTQLLL